MRAVYEEARRELAGAGLPAGYNGMVDKWLTDAIRVMEADPELVKKIQGMSGREYKDAAKDPKVLKDIKKLLEPTKRKGRRTRLG